MKSFVRKFIAVWKLYDKVENLEKFNAVADDGEMQAWLDTRQGQKFADILIDLLNLELRSAYQTAKVKNMEDYAFYQGKVAVLNKIISVIKTMVNAKKQEATWRQNVEVEK